ncbi:MAG: hypothetical protein ACI8ZM_001202 [Crocinitomix sp.]|jgi:hypothetical protein
MHFCTLSCILSYRLMQPLKSYLFCLLLGLSPSVLATYNCVFYAVIENAFEVNKTQFDSIQFTRVKQKVKLMSGDKPVWIGLNTKSPITRLEIDSTLTKIKRKWNGDSVVFINESNLWQTITPSNYKSFIDTTHYVTPIKTSCWGGMNWISCKNKIRRNKAQLVSKVKSDQFICVYTYDQNNRVKSANIKYRKRKIISESTPCFAEFIYDATGKIIAIKTRSCYSNSIELDYFTIAYF